MTPALAMEGAGGGGPSVPAGSQPSSFADFVTFRRMITPIAIQILFWFAEVGNVIFWINFMTRTRTIDTFGNSTVSGTGVFFGILLMVGSAITIRIYLEVLIVVFRINENVLVIRRTVQR